MVICPPCGWSGKEFLPFGKPERKNAQCPECDSKERHRYLYKYLESVLTNEVTNVLHIAPSEALRRLFLSHLNINYVSIDISPERLNAMKKEDLTDLTFEDEIYDIIFASHVLEHIPDEKEALSEIYRVMKPDGFAILHVPLFDRDYTIEDDNYDKDTRVRLFGQWDHVRAYGRDFIDRLRGANFEVEVRNYLDDLTTEEIQKYALVHNVKGTPLHGQSQEDIYVCRK